MSHRADLVWIEDGVTKIYHSKLAHWVTNILAQGYSTCKVIFSGYADYHGNDEELFLMDNGWAEGGLLIDVDKRHIIIHGGSDDISYTPCLRRYFFKEVQPIWKDYSLRWAARGNSELALYLGIPEEQVLIKLDEPIYQLNTEPLSWNDLEYKSDRQTDVITIIRNGQIKDYGLDYGFGEGIKHCIEKGDRLADIFPDEHLITKWKKETETLDTLLIDYDKKTIYVCWGCDEDDRLVEAIRALWKGWEVNRQDDGLLFHFKYTNRNPIEIEMTEEDFKNYPVNLFNMKDD